MLTVGENPRSKIEEFNREFLSDFVRLLRSSHGEKPINANRFYQEYIANKDHIHMNATRWASLSELVGYLGSKGMVKVDNTEKDGLCIAYVDNSPDAIERRDYLKRRQNAEVDEDEREAKLLSKRIEEATKNKQQQLQHLDKADDDDDKVKHELKREEGITRLSIASGNKLAFGGLKKAVTKKPNVFAASKVHKSSKSSQTSKKPTSVLEQIMLRDQQRKGQGIR